MFVIIPTRNSSIPHSPERSTKSLMLLQFLGTRAGQNPVDPGSKASCCPSISLWRLLLCIYQDATHPHPRIPLPLLLTDTQGRRQQSIQRTTTEGPSVKMLQALVKYRDKFCHQQKYGFFVASYGKA